MVHISVKESRTHSLDLALNRLRVGPMTWPLAVGDCFIGFLWSTQKEADGRLSICFWATLDHVPSKAFVLLPKENTGVFLTE